MEDPITDINQQIAFPASLIMEELIGRCGAPPFTCAPASTLNPEAFVFF